VAAGFQHVTLVEEGEVFGDYNTSWHDRAEVVASEGFSQLVWGTPVVTRSVSINPITLAGDGTLVGSARFTVDGKATEVPLELEGDIADPGPVWRLENP